VEIEPFERSLRAFCRRVPFQPFRIELTSGSTLRIYHPEALIVRNGVAVFFATDNEITLFDHSVVAKLTSDLDVATPAS